MKSVANQTTVKVVIEDIQARRSSIKDENAAKRTDTARKQNMKLFDDVLNYYTDFRQMGYGINEAIEHTTDMVNLEINTIRILLGLP